MAQVLTNFLVGIGFQVDKKGQKEVESSIENIKVKALQAGAVLAGAFGISIVNSLASSNDALGKFSNRIGVTAQQVRTLDKALQLEGAQPGAAFGVLENLEQLRIDRALTGGGPLFQQLGLAGVDQNAVRALVDAENVVDGLISFADTFAGLSRQQQIRVADVLGLDEPGRALLSQGSAQVRSTIKTFDDLIKTTGQNAVEAAALNNAYLILGTTMEGVGERITNSFIAPMTKAVKTTQELINKLNKLVSDGSIDKFSAGVPAILAGIGLGAGSAALSTAGAAAGALGLAGIAAIGTTLGSAFATAAVLGLSVGVGTIINELIPTSAGNVIGAGVNALVALTGDKAAQERFNLDFFGGTESLLQSAAAPMAAPVAGGGRTTLNINLNMDGEKIKQFVIDVNERQNQITLDALTTSEGG